MAANSVSRVPLGMPSVARLTAALERMGEGLEVLEAELLVAALRAGTSVSPWTHDRLSTLAATLDELRDAIDTAPRDAG